MALRLANIKERCNTFGSGLEEAAKSNNGKSVSGRERDAQASDRDWKAFLRKVQENRKQAMQHLVSEFQNKSKEHGKCVEFLKKILNQTYRLFQSSLDGRVAEQCVIVIYRVLFDLADGQWTLPSQVTDDMVSTGNIAVRDFPSSALVQCVQRHAMRDMNNDSREMFTIRWTEIFVKFLAVLYERDDVPHESDTLSGKKYRELIIEHICRMNWRTQIVRHYLSVIEEISVYTGLPFDGLNGYEIDVVMEKFETVIATLPLSFVAGCVPPIVSVSGTLRPSRLLELFDKYFVNLKEKQTDDAGVSFSSTDEDQRSRRRGTQANKTPLGKVVSYFVDAARDNDPIIREIQKRVKASLFDHTLVMNPFILTVILGLSNVDYLRVTLIDPLKLTIIKCFHEVNLIYSSSWYKDTIGNIRDDLYLCFKYVLEEGSEAMEYMSEGVKELGISLLNAVKLQGKFPLTLRRCQELGSYLVTTAVMKNKEQLHCILMELLKPDSDAHIECLAGCLSQCARAIGHHGLQGRLCELFQHIPMMTVSSASAVVKSLTPAIHISPPILDDLMIVLRKTFWKSIEASRICIEVVCVILSNTYVLGDSQLMGPTDDDDLIYSQYTQQTSKTCFVDHTPLCRDLLYLVKRFYSLDRVVREQLYLGLHRVARRNPKVNDIIADQLFAQASLYLTDSWVSKIFFSKLFKFSPASSECKIAVVDELGFLVQCIGFVYNKTILNLDKFQDILNDASSFNSCKGVLSTFIEVASEMTVDRMEVIIASIIQSSQMAAEEIGRFVRDTTCVQMLQIMEALIEFLTFCPEWSEAKQKVSTIFNNYVDLEKFLKGPVSKKGKGEKGKTKKAKPAKNGDATSTTAIGDDDVSSIASSDVATTVGNGGNKTKGKRQDLKATPNFHLINLDSVCKMLREIYGPDNNNHPLGSVRRKDEFEMLLLHTVRDKVMKLKSKDTIRERQRAPVDFLNSLSCLIEAMWGRMTFMESKWITRNENPNRSTMTLPDSSEVVEARLEIIAIVLEYFFREGHHDRVHFRKFSDHQETINESCHYHLYFQEWKKVLTMVNKDFSSTSGKGSSYMLRYLNYMSRVSSAIDTLREIHDWCWNYMKEQDSDVQLEGTAAMLEVIVDVFLACETKAYVYSTEIRRSGYKLAKTIPGILGVIDRDSQGPGADISWLIKKDTATSLLCSFVTYVGKQLDMLDTVLGRLKAHRVYLGNEKSIEIREKCIKMLQCSRTITTELVRAQIPAGPWAYQLLKVVTKYYHVVSNYTEHLKDINKYKVDLTTIRSFKKLVYDLGHDFKPMVDSLISHVELVQRAVVLNRKKTKNGLSYKSSKDGKIIPDLVFWIEKFDSLVIELSKKTKENMVVGTKLTTARDFRIVNRKIKELLEKNKRPTTGDATVIEPPPTQRSTAPKTTTAPKATTGKLSRKRKSD